MANYTFSSYSTPAQSLQGYASLGESFGSDISTVSLAQIPDIAFPTAISLIDSALVYQLGSSLTDPPLGIFDCAEAGCTASFSIATSSGGGSTPTTGQIFPRGVN